MADANLVHITSIGTQQHNLTPGHARHQHQAVKGIILDLAGPHPDQKIVKVLTDPVELNTPSIKTFYSEVMNPDDPTTAICRLVGKLTHHPQPQVFKHGQDAGE